MSQSADTPPRRGEAPNCNCLILCDDVSTYVARGKHVLHGVIGSIVVRSLPAEVGPLVAYLRFTNVYPGTKIQIRLEHSTAQEHESSAPPVFVIEMEWKGVQPLDQQTLLIPIPPFELRLDGRYLFTASHDGTEFASCPVSVVDTSKQEAP